MIHDGAAAVIGPDHVFSLALGRDAWTVGDEPAMAVAFGGIEQYAKR